MTVSGIVVAAVGCSLDSLSAKYDAGVGSVAPDATPAVADFCADAAFCDEFERSTGEVVGSWGQVWGAAGPLTIVASGGSRNAGAFLRVTVPPGPEIAAMLTHSMNRVARVRLAFALRVSALSARNVDVGVVQFVLGSGKINDIYLALEPPAVVEVFEHTSDNGTPTHNVSLSTASLPIGRWIPAVFVVDPVKTPPEITVDLDGQRLLARKPLGIEVAGIPPAVAGGVEWAQDTAYDAGASVIDIDDVRVDFLP